MGGVTHQFLSRTNYLTAVNTSLGAESPPVPKDCPTPTVPHNTAAHCTTTTPHKLGTVCHFPCKPGFQRFVTAAATSTLCNVNGAWQDEPTPCARTSTVRASRARISKLTLSPISRAPIHKNSYIFINLYSS